MTNGDLIKLLQQFPEYQTPYIEIQTETDRQWCPILAVEAFNIPREGNVINIVPDVKA